VVRAVVGRAGGSSGGPAAVLEIVPRATAPLVWLINKPGHREGNWRQIFRLPRAANLIPGHNDPFRHCVAAPVQTDAQRLTCTAPA
jgi:hypothetical protein